MKNNLNFFEKDFSMPAWLYQMSSGGSGGLWHDAQYQPWYPSSYRQDVIEGLPIRWDVGKIYLRTNAPASTGDTVIFFFCKTGKNDPKTGNFQPGIYGWGKITDPPQDGKKQIEFVVQPPSDYLKITVLWDNDIERITNQIRAGQNQGTMWPIGRNHLQELQSKIMTYIARVK